MDQPTEKTCTKCGEVKALAEFSRHPRGRHGRQSRCKACFAAYRAENADKVRAGRAKYEQANRDKIAARRLADRERERERTRAYYAANRDRVRAKQAAYRAATREQKKARDAEYREANRERLRIYHLDYAEAHREESRRRAKAWMRANPDRVAEIQRRRRARLVGATVGPVDVDALWTGTCGICAADLDRSIKWPDMQSPSVDHITPLAKGGSHSQDNLQWTCLGCNLRKGDRLDT